MVSSLFLQLKLDSNHLDQVARLCVPYLSDAQPQTLQQVSQVLLSQSLMTAGILT